MPKIIIASGPVIVENGKVLLNKHGDTTFWKFCGGKVEDFDTTLLDNARREAREEVGIELTILDETPYFYYTKKETGDGFIDVILVHYLASRVGEVVAGDDIDEWAWLDIAALPADLAPNIIPALTHFKLM